MEDINGLLGFGLLPSAMENFGEAPARALVLLDRLNEHAYTQRSAFLTHAHKMPFDDLYH